MKKGIHPENYRLVAFKDMSNDHVFLCRSAVSTKVIQFFVSATPALQYFILYYKNGNSSHPAN